MGPRESSVLVDTNVMIEAARTGIWNALAGGLRIETVEECCVEINTGNNRPGRTTVDLSRLSEVHGVTALERAEFGLAYPDAADLDAGERDLMAHAYARSRQGQLLWSLCSPDRALVRAAVALDWRERMTSLEKLSSRAGGRPSPPLARQFTEQWLSECWTDYLLKS